MNPVKRRLLAELVCLPAVRGGDVGACSDGQALACDRSCFAPFKGCKRGAEGPGTRRQCVTRGRPRRVVAEVTRELAQVVLPGAERPLCLGRPVIPAVHGEYGIWQGTGKAWDGSVGPFW